MSDYTDRIKAVCGANLQGLWTFGDASNPVTDISGNGRNATATGFTFGQAGIGDGGTSVSLSGGNNIVSPAIGGWDGAAGTMALWAKVSAAGVWTDTTLRWLTQIYVDGSNRVEVYRNGTNNQLSMRFVSGGNFATYAAIIGPSTSWFHLAITWDASKAYFYQDGVQKTNIARTTFTGTPTSMLIGTSSNSWSGYMADVIYINRTLDAAQIALLARVTVPTLTLTGEITTAISREGKL